MSLQQEPAYANDSNKEVDAKKDDFAKNGDDSILTDATTQNGDFIVDVAPSVEPKATIQPQTSDIITERTISAGEKVTAMVLAFIFTGLGIIVVIVGGSQAGWVSTFGFLPSILTLYLCFGSKSYPERNIGVDLLIAGINISALTLGFSCFFLAYWDLYFRVTSTIGFISGSLALLLSVGSWATARIEGLGSIFQNVNWLMYLLTFNVIAIVRFCIDLFYLLCLLFL